jgi:peptidoglycan/xylan/chitin deacetylase (PgdA/CDA1 family)
MTYADFEQEMAWLHSDGYEAVTLDELMDNWCHGGTLPTKPIVIAFDNGYPPQVTEAPRVLSQYGWPGVLNEITEDHLSDAKLKSVLKLGWEIDSHSLTHPDLTALTASELQAQVVQSRQYLPKHLGVPSNSFCYPSSDDNATVEAAVKSAGYEDATTEISSYASPTGDPYQLPRFEMTTDLPQSQADLAEPH